MKIKVKHVKTNEETEFDVLVDEKLSILIDKLSLLYKCEPKDIKLICQQRLLKPNQTIAEQHIEEHSVLIATGKIGSAQTIDSKTQSPNKPSLAQISPPQQFKESNIQNQDEQTCLNSIDEEPLPKSYTSLLILQNQRKPLEPIHQIVQNTPRFDPTNIPPELIMGLDQDPLLPTYIEDLMQHPERIAKQLQNDKFLKYMRDFFGEDPIACATLSNPQTFTALLQQSMNSYKQTEAKLMSNPQHRTQILKSTYGGALARIQETGIEFDENEALSLLDQYKGDVQTVIGILMAKYE